MTCSAKPVKGDFSVQACVLTCALVSVEMEHVRETCARRDCCPNRREEGDRVPRASAIHRFCARGPCFRVVHVRSIYSDFGSVGSRRFFSFLYLKKQNFKNICQIGKFSKMGVCRPFNGRRGACRPSSWRQDLNVKKFTFRSWHPGRIKQ